MPRLEGKEELSAPSVDLFTDGVALMSLSILPAPFNNFRIFQGHMDKRSHSSNIPRNGAGQPSMRHYPADWLGPNLEKSTERIYPGTSGIMGAGMCECRIHFHQETLQAPSKCRSKSSS